MPEKDASQDWFLLHAEEDDFGTVLKFVRKLTTCDTQDDLVIEVSRTQNNHIIFKNRRSELTCVFACVHGCACVYTFICALGCARVYVCVHIRVCTYVRVCLRACMVARVCTFTTVLMKVEITVGIFVT